MRYPGSARRLRNAGICCALASLLSSAPAAAQQSYIIPGILAGSGSLFDFDTKAQWGFGPTSPLYVDGEVQYGALPTVPRQDSFRFLIAAGVEIKRFGGNVHYENLNIGGYAQSLNHLGYNIRYRFIPFVILSGSEKTHLHKSEQERLIAKRQKEQDDAVATAPIISLDYDAIAYSSPLLTAGQLHSTRAILSFEWQITRWWTVVPKIDAYSYERDPTNDPAANTALSSGALRLYHIGPFAEGPYSGIFGAINSAQQIFSKVKINPLLNFVFAASRIQIDTPGVTAYSYFFGMERRFTRWDKWSITPAYEHINSNQTYGFFSVFLRYNFNEPYQPRNF